jgi:thioredoxin 1
MRTLLILSLAVLFSGLPSAGHGADLLIFSADWCSSCQALKTAIEDDPTLVDGYAVSVIDFDKNADLAKGYKIESIPTLLHLQPGGKIRRKVGFKNTHELKRWLEDKNAQPAKSRRATRRLNYH